ncbi:MAG: magnetic particle protein [Gammaproteobacteria bacterium]|nr:MAG: magnetic particle protein [Gammaproteobacteria bacterium]
MTNVTHYFFRSSINSGVIGGLVGIMVSGAANIRDYREGKIDATDASISVGKDAIGTGVATGVSVAVAGAVGSSLLLALAVGIGVKYAWDAGVERLEHKPS